MLMQTSSFAGNSSAVSLMGLGADGSPLDVMSMVKVAAGLGVAVALYAFAFKQVQRGGSWKPAMLLVGGGAAAALVLRGL